MRVSDDRRGQGRAGTDLPPFLARGWYVSGAWVVAGAADVASVARPARPLFQGGFGSIQLAVRRERLILGSLARTDATSTSPRAETVLGNSETATTVGAAWHLNRWIAIEANVIREAHRRHVGHGRCRICGSGAACFECGWPSDASCHLAVCRPAGD